MTTTFHPSKSVVFWLWSGMVLILIMVVIGGMTRLTHSGLSMVHWSFTGSLPPMSEVAWDLEFEKYQTSPEYIELHNHFSLDDFKSIFWWEFIHRMFGRMIGIVFIIPFVIFWRKKLIPKSMLPKFFMILALGALQAFLGWFMVKSGLIDVPRVSHFRLAAHLITAFITCAYIYWVMQYYKGYGHTYKSISDGRKYVLILLALLVAQIVYGGFVAGLKAGWVHNTWQLMDGELISDAVTAMDPIWINFLEGMSGVQFIHRTLGLVVLLTGLWIGFFSNFFKEERYELYPKFVAIALLIQFALGVLTLLFYVPISLAVIHQVFALVTLICLTGLLFKANFTKLQH
jgi:heme a synthase